MGVLMKVVNICRNRPELARDSRSCRSTIGPILEVAVIA
jgi:hypothetical protein